jgi:hypothetical protein
LFLETLPRRGSRCSKSRAARTYVVAGTIGSRSRSRSQPQYMYTVLCVMSRLPLFDIYLIFHPQFHPRTRATPKDPRRGRPLAAQPRWPAGPAPSSFASAPRTRRTWRPRWRDLDLTRRTTNCQRKTRHAFNESTICKNLDPVPGPGGGGCLEPTLKDSFQYFRHTRHIYMYDA